MQKNSAQHAYSHGRVLPRTHLVCIAVGSRAVVCPQILTEPGWCYVVSLSATGGMALAAMPGMQAAAAASTDSTAEAKRSLSGATSLEERLAALDLQTPAADESATDLPTAPGSVEKPEAHSKASGQHPQQHSQPASASEAFHDDPLRRANPPSTVSTGLSKPRAAAREGEARPVLPGSAGQGGQAGTGDPGGPVVNVQLFTGFVSYEQLEEVIGSGWERRAAARKEMTHWIKMKGPGEPFR